MTTMQQPVESAAPDAIQKEPVAATRPISRVPLIIAMLLVVLLFAGTYAIGWYNAYRLSTRFLEDADRSYEEGDYLIALTGQETYNSEAQQYEEVGGYIDVERIWSHPYSWPAPGIVAQAAARADEIIYQELTIAQAEQYVQANIGRSAPYFAEIYFHLGELYLQEGDEIGAREIYESIPQLFPGREDLIEEAEQRLGEMEE